LALALFFAYHHFCRPHTTLTESTWIGEGLMKKKTPAMAAGLAGHVWAVAALMERAREAA
jgi:hypothetical protein